MNSDRSEYAYWNTSENGIETPAIANNYADQMSKIYQANQLGLTNADPKVNLSYEDLLKSNAQLQSQIKLLMQGHLHNSTLQLDFPNANIKPNADINSKTIKEINIKITIEVTND